MKSRFHSTGQASARGLALDVLLRCRAHTAFIQELMDEALSQSQLSPADRRLATQLTYGVLRRRGTLDTLLAQCASRRQEQVEPWLWECLRLGAFQLALLSHIPPHAAIFESVALADEIGKPRGKGFLNAVLRRVAGLLTDASADRPAADALPLEAGRYRRLSEAVFPDPCDTATAQGQVGYLAGGFSLPNWLVRRWLELFGWEECVRLGFWFAGPAPLWLRSNPLRIDRDRFLAALAEVDIKAEPGDLPQSVRLLDHAPVHAVPGFAEGWFTVQDQSAMQVAAALAPGPGDTVLDLCAAPGGKTTHLAELMHNRGRIVACDVDDRRLDKLTGLARRVGVTIIEPRRLAPRLDGLGGDAEEPPAGPFDAVLVDVPCSNTGVLGRRPEARWRLKPEDLPHLVRLQTRLLLQAAERVRPGGAIVYSTCSVEPEENAGVVATALKMMPHLALEAEQCSVPGRPADGGYWAKLRHSGTV